MSFQKPIQKFGMDVGEVLQLKFWRKIQKWKICLKMTFCMNVSRFMNLAAIFSLDLESQFMEFEPFHISAWDCEPLWAHLDITLTFVEHISMWALLIIRTLNQRYCRWESPVRGIPPHRAGPWSSSHPLPCRSSPARRGPGEGQDTPQWCQHVGKVSGPENTSKQPNLSEVCFLALFLWL